MSVDLAHPTQRRDFLTRLGAAAAVVAGTTAVAPRSADAEESDAPLRPLRESPWDVSWVDRLSGVPHRVVFDANNIADGFALDLTTGFMDQLHEVYGTRDDQTRAVIVMRQLGTPMAFGDALWDKYAIGEDANVKDPATHAPARRNPFLNPPPGASAESGANKLSTLMARGTIVLVCSIAANNVAARLAEKRGRDVEEVRKDVRSGLVPGAILAPSGIFALIRAQNAGCAYMRGA
jgi:hypothetical protein